MDQEPYTLQRQINEVLTNDDYTIILRASEIQFIRSHIVNKPALLKQITSIIDEENLFMNMRINIYNIPAVVLKIADLFNATFLFESVYFLSNITRFILDCILTYKAHVILVSELDKIDYMLDNCIKMLGFQLRVVPSVNSKKGFFSLFDFCN